MFVARYGPKVRAGFTEPPLIGPIQAGSIRPLGVTTPKRSGALPDVPTFMEGGVPDFAVPSWHGVVGPAGLPPEIVQKLNAAINDWLREDAAKKALAAQTLRPLGGTPDMLKQRVETEIRKWEPVVKSANITLGN